MSITKNADQLISDIRLKRANWNERSSFTLKGIKNLSNSDLDTLILYAQNAINHPDNPEYGYMRLRGDLRQIFIAYRIIKE